MLVHYSWYRIFRVRAHYLLAIIRMSTHTPYLRQFGKFLAAVLILAIPMAGSSAYAKKENARIESSDENVTHLLNRITFGPRPGDIEYVKSVGINSFIEQQLNPQSIPESKSVLDCVASSELKRESNEDLLRLFKAVQDERAKINAQKALQEAISAPYPPLAPDRTPSPLSDMFNRAQKQFLLANLTRDLESPRQLEAVMEEFWFNHFNIFSGKEFDGLLIQSYEDEAIRPHVFGRFRDLLGATCHHPAMLYYLDNSQNRASPAGSSSGSSKVNENYARELMELHTLGVDGGYSQNDVIELARILTGLTIATYTPTKGLAQARNLLPAGASGCYFNMKQHDMGDKVLLGHKIKGSGPQEIEEALDILANDPATAHHICYQLAQYFLADDPPKHLVKKLVDRFTKTGGDIKAVLAELFHSDEFWDSKYYSAKFKTPLRYEVSVLRAANAHIENADSLGGFLNQQGQRMYGCITPDGYKNTRDVWMEPEALLQRIEFALSIGSGKRKGVILPSLDANELEKSIGICTFSKSTLDTIEKAPNNLKAAAVFGSREFMRY